MSKHPYSDLPDKAFWRRSVAQVAYPDVDPETHHGFRLSADDRIATGGSCFAQHIARHLRQNGYNYFVAEQPHPLLSSSVAESFGYGVYSARYGNIYTARQLSQLMRRACGEFVPVDRAWRSASGYVDPFRPTVQPGGYVSVAELERDREQHFAAVRRMVEDMDVFVFTLGLTECWVDREDGAVYQLCPGTTAGEFVEGRHIFTNQGVDDVVDDVSDFIGRVRTLNRRARFILTVSPTPMIATAAARHVLVSNTYSKAVLRVAAERIVEAFDGVAYFPSFEIVVGLSAAGARYYSSHDRRSVVEDGLEHVMRIFFRHFVGATPQATEKAPEAAPKQPAQRLVEAMCDEVALDANADRNGHAPSVSPIQAAAPVEVVDRRASILHGIDASAGPMLEVGPLYRPLLRKAESDVTYADHLNTDDLRRKYATDRNVPLDLIAPVDVVVGSTGLREAAEGRGPFTTIVASHVLEHVPDLVGWLADVHALLTDGGTLCLALPDKRYTFDLFRRSSRLKDALDAHAEHRTRPSIEVVCDAFRNSCGVTADLIWRDAVEPDRLEVGWSLPDLRSALDRHAAGEYVDVHCWVFSPPECLQLLAQVIGATSLGLEPIYFRATLPGEEEFHLQLRRSRRTTAPAWAGLLAAAGDGRETWIAPSAAHRSSVAA